MIMHSVHLFLVTCITSAIKTSTVLEKRRYIFGEINRLFRIIHKSFHCTSYLVAQNVTNELRKWR
jgi:hypothetical protein